jgi:hypothetical protein
MIKGKYFKCITDQNSNITLGKFYSVLKETVTKDDHQFMIKDDFNVNRLLSSRIDIAVELQYRNFFTIHNVNHSVDDLLDKYNMYKELYKMFKLKRYSKMMKVIQTKFEEATGGIKNGKETGKKSINKTAKATTKKAN